MPLVSCVTDVDSGHDGWPSRPIVSGQSNYTINGLDIATVGSELASHCKPKAGCHSGSIASGSTNYTIRGMPIARITSAVSCGGALTTGQANYDIP